MLQLILAVRMRYIKCFEVWYNLLTSNPDILAWLIGCNQWSQGLSRSALKTLIDLWDHLTDFTELHSPYLTIRLQIIGHVWAIKHYISSYLQWQFSWCSCVVFLKILITAVSGPNKANMDSISNNLHLSIYDSMWSWWQRNNSKMVFRQFSSSKHL